LSLLSLLNNLIYYLAHGKHTDFKMCVLCTLDFFAGKNVQRTSKNCCKNVNGFFIYFIAEVECRDPMSPKNGYIEVSNFKGKISRGILTVLLSSPSSSCTHREGR
jgi:hypothetical protein